ncbi:unnamed protein product (macronuclear) [Paramecium tetraurelia]|uniref:Uncharacterized protein n=1 Tax=Paramecium tetraurelia TaxID=5888 RepID=A0BQY1_PARTE|nr:uncharacterized protein GSPATT00031177001 [Paramecium tetraurelia]CAK60948.1 unnamed protein product [Paramecium tetraurelia]|eukprot:XP_001428346.1 hypothetical protein (macronuclear) [Paramecium tetraurelia strain d4-2]
MYAKWRRTSQQKYPDLSQLYKNQTVTRRRSCYCDNCGKLSQFQQIHQNNGWVPLQIQIDESKKELELQKTQTDEKQQISKNSRTMSTSISQTPSFYKNQDQRPRRNSCTCSECGPMSQFQIKHKDVPFKKQKKSRKLFVIKRKNLTHSRTIQLEQMQSRSRIDPRQLIQQKNQMMSLRNIDVQHRRLRTECMSLSQIVLPAIKDFSCRQIKKQL